MAQIVEEYRSWTFQRIRIAALTTTRRKHDPLSPFLMLRTVLTIALRSIVRSDSIYVIHVSQGGSFIREGAVVLVCRLMNQPVAVQLHGSSQVAFMARHERLSKYLMNRASRVLVLSQESFGALLNIGVPAAKIVEVRNAVRLEPKSVPKERVVLFAGEVGNRKGVPQLLSAWRAVGSAHADWTLCLAGPINPEARSIEIPPGVEMLGRVERARVLDLANRAAIAVLPSRAETLPIFLLEAMARDCAVISTRVGEIPTLVDGCGLLVDVGDVHALESSLRSLITNDEQRSYFQKNARARVSERYSDTVVAQQMESIWLAVAEQSGGSSA